MTWLHRIYRERHELLVGVTLLAVTGLSVAGPGCDAKKAEALAPSGGSDKRSDLNRDGVVDLEDVKLLAASLGVDWETFDWCTWTDEESSKHREDLFALLRDHFQCDEVPPPPPPPPEDPLEVRNRLTYPARIAIGVDGRRYVTDPKVGSLFIYDSGEAPVGELKGLAKPLGVAVDAQGTIYVGNNGRDNVEKYAGDGTLVSTMGSGKIRMPNDLALDADDNLYVADSLSNLVWVFAPDGTVLQTFRHGAFRFPVAVEITYLDDGTGQLVGELFVGDKDNYLVKVFDLDGNLLRTFGGFPRKGGMMGTTWDWHGRFIGLQSLAVDAQGRLHALDNYMNKVQILDPVTGAYLGDYGETGTGLGQLKVPLDILIDGTHQVLAANAHKGRVEVIYTVP